MTDLVGQSLGPYTVTERIGAGGMAEVYKAFHADLSVYRALKVIRPEFRLTHDFRARFQKEARSAASLRHPNIVQVHDFGTHGDSCYMVMEFIEGQDLRRVLRERGRIRPIREALDLIVQVANALDYAHARGLIHRDIKPENIMIAANGQPILTDFGIAKLLNGATQLTQTGSSLGTPAYMAPEQALATQEVGPPADVYALTIVLFELLTGRTPYQASTPVAAIVKSISDPMPTPRSLASDIDEALQRVILKGAAKDIEERFPSVASLRDALIEVAQRDARSSASQATLVDERTQIASNRGRSRSPVFIAAGIAAIAVAAGASFWALATRETGRETVAAPEAQAPPHVASANDAVGASAVTAPAQILDQPGQQLEQESADTAETRGETTAQPSPAIRDDKAERPEVKRSIPPQLSEVRADSQSDRTPVTGLAEQPQPTAAGNAPDPAMLQPTMTATAAPASSAPSSSQGLAQVRRGETTQGDLIRLFGGPNLTTLDEVGRETWVYERTQTQRDVNSTSQAAQATARLGLFFGSVSAGGAIGKTGSTETMTTSSAVRSVTVIVKFAPDRTVHDYTVRETYF